MDFEETNIQNLRELKSGLLKENDKIQRLQIFAKGDKVGIKHLDEVENMSTEDTIGANYYLAQYLSQYINSCKTSDEQFDFDQEQSKLEKEFGEHLLPFLSKQAVATNNYILDITKMGWRIFGDRNSDETLARLQKDFDAKEVPLSYSDYMGELTMDQSLKNIVDKLADISFKKIASNKHISEKDYGFILTKIALYIGNFADLPKYNMLYLSLYSELIQEKDYGSYAESYLKNMVLSKGLIDSRFYPEDENKSIER